jgi:hypothetical protein
MQIPMAHSTEDHQIISTSTVHCIYGKCDALVVFYNDGTQEVRCAMERPVIVETLYTFNGDMVQKRGVTGKHECPEEHCPYEGN